MANPDAAGASQSSPVALSLPEHWWQENIFPLLDVVAVSRLACTCKTFRDLVSQPGTVDWKALAVQHFKLSDKQLEDFQLLRDASHEQAKYLLRQIAEALSKFRQGRFIQTNRPKEEALFIRQDGSLFGWSRFKKNSLYVSLCCLNEAETVYSQVALIKLVHGRLPDDRRDLQAGWLKTLASAIFGPR